MKLRGTPEHIIAEIVKAAPEVATILRMARQLINGTKGHIYEYQAACLYVMAKGHENILEIGTLIGYSAYVLAEAAPEACIITLNPNEVEAAIAKKALARFPNVRVDTSKSWSFLDWYGGPAFDMIFVDGDHKKIALDMPWWNRLTIGGLMLWHDYTPSGAPRPCPPVYNAINDWAARLGRALDVEVIDNDGVGLAGLYRCEGEVWG